MKWPLRIYVCIYSFSYHCMFVYYNLYYLNLYDCISLYLRLYSRYLSYNSFNFCVNHISYFLLPKIFKLHIFILVKNIHVVSEICYYICCEFLWNLTALENWRFYLERDRFPNQVGTKIFENYLYVLKK